MSVTSSATSAVSSIFNVVTTTATTVDRSLSSLDDVTRAMQARSRAWSNKSIHMTNLRARADIGLGTLAIEKEIAEKLKEYEKFNEDPANQGLLERARTFLAEPKAAA